MSVRALAVLAVAALAASPAPAADDQTFARCQQKAGGITVELQACNVAELARRDMLLNQTYGQLLSALPVDRQAKLRTAERTWLAFADAECAFRTSSETGGTDAPLIEESCRLSLVATRVADLQQALRIARF